MAKGRFTPPEECPVCGAPVPRGARSCPNCGADERTGWDEEQTHYDGMDLPESAFEDEPPPRPKLRRSVSPWLIIVAILVMVAFVLLVL